MTPLPPPDPAAPDPTPFLREAIALSVENVAAGRGGPFGAVVVRRGVVIAQGVNCVTAALDPTAHAEIEAIRSACRGLKSFSLAGCVLYSSCEPCPMCLSAAYWARLDAVYWAATQADAARAGFDDAFLYAQIALPPDARTLPQTPVPALQDEARAAFRLWDMEPGRVRY